MGLSKSPASATRMWTPPLWVELLALSLSTGCGSPAAPAPPSLNLPRQVANLSAERVGNTVTLHWTMPADTTDGLTLHGILDTGVCRSVGAASCASVKKLQLNAGASAEAANQLPSDLSTGSARLLAYRVTVFNRKHRDAGASKPVYVAAGAPPPTPSGLTAVATKHGVLLQWQPLRGDDLKEFLVQRDLITAPGRPASNAPKASASAGQSAPPKAAADSGKQTLRIPVALGPDGKPAAPPRRALDATAVFGATYRYTIQSVSEPALDSHPAKVISDASQPVIITPLDKFPPAPPTGLDTVLVSPPAQGPPATNRQSYSIDLSWTPNRELDIAGYNIYRQEAGTPAASLRISPAAPVPASAFTDANVQPGHTYTYTVTAVDQAGNESPPSQPQEQAMPAVQPQTP